MRHAALQLRPSISPSSVGWSPSARARLLTGARSWIIAAILLPALSMAFPAPPLQAQSQNVVDPSLYAGMEYRMVGPFRGGRVTAVTGIAEDPHTFFFGGTGGGVWKTDDAGHHWVPIADDYLTAGAVGAIDVADSDPNVIYVGTGSACIRGNVSVGRGLWRTTDGGDAWEFIGLPESGAIGALAVHPADPDLVYAAALGHPFGKNPERGVYRSKDGGDTWEKVLFLNDSTGAVSLAMNPRNPRIIYAGMWRAERKPWTLISGGPEGGVYRTSDGGDSWTKLAGGLPEGIVGKVTVTVSRANPDRVWAMVEAEPGNGLYRSDDAGATWTFLTGESDLTGRAFYYHHVIADPGDQNTVYVLNTRMYRSVDGGENFELIPVHHGDVHDLWINPLSPGIFVVGDDGGAEVSLNGGRTLSGVYNQPTAEFYDVMVDNDYPYRIYGSQQDNTTISVLAHRLGNTLRPQEEWQYAAGCEVGPIAFDPDNPDVIWSGCYGGVINRMVVSTDVRRNVNLYPANQNRAPKDLRHRFQWVAPIVMDPLDPNTVYHASQYVHRTRDEGMTWETISPDLTTNTPEHQEFPGIPIHSDHTGVEVFNTVFSLVPSPHEAGTIWVGSDDGRVHLTRNDGETWTDITPPDMPQYGTVNRIEVSPHDPARAFLAVQRYRMDDWRPYVFRTTDFGASWTLLTSGANGIPADHWVRVVREDDVRKGLLYAGTEFGIFVSLDDGNRWQPLQMNLPATPVTDLKVHRGDLVVATQGRSFWVLDDLTPIREWAAAPVTGPVRLFTPRDAARGRATPPLSEMDLDQPDPLPQGALLSYVVTEDAQGLTMEVLDAQDRVAGRWEAGSNGNAGLSTEPGFHRLAWPLRYLEDGGVKAPPGEYRVRLTWEGGSQERPFRVLANPNDPSVSQADYEEQFRVTMEVQLTSQDIRDALRGLRETRDQSRAVLARARSAEREVGDLPELADSMEARLAPLEAELTSVDDPTVPTGQKRPQGGGLDREYRSLMNHLNSGGGYGPGSTEGRPTSGAMARKRELDGMWNRVRANLEEVLEAEVAAFNAEVARLGLEGIVTR
ncbi:WD40/YVTN/BNR-like repeat-containing protein [Gemmatimonadota bacterium]